MKSDFIAPPWEQSAQTPDNQLINPKQLQGLWIPAEYLYADDLSAGEQVLMAYIRMMDQDKHCFASNKYLGELMRCSEKRIRNMLVDLKRKGYIETLTRNPRTIKCLK
jgi:hypothetical protein